MELSNQYSGKQRTRKGIGKEKERKTGKTENIVEEKQNEGSRRNRGEED